MTQPIEYLLWAPDRATFIATMAALTLPDGRRLAYLAIPNEPGGNDIYFIEGCECSEIGLVVKTPAVLDDDGNVVEPAVIVGGYHVNMHAYGWLAELLTDGMPAEGGVFERTRILDLLGDMDWEPSAVGEPPGYVGRSGVKIFDPATVNHRVRVWWTLPAPA